MLIRLVHPVLLCVLVCTHKARRLTSENEIKTQTERRRRNEEQDKSEWERESQCGAVEKNHRVPFGRNTCSLITHSCVSASVTNYPPAGPHTGRRQPAGRPCRRLPLRARRPVHNILCTARYRVLGLITLLPDLPRAADTVHDPVVTFVHSPRPPRRLLPARGRSCHTTSRLLTLARPPVRSDSDTPVADSRRVRNWKAPPTVLARLSRGVRSSQWGARKNNRWDEKGFCLILRAWCIERAGKLATPDRTQKFNPNFCVYMYSGK